jgi:hypothetical protein
MPEAGVVHPIIRVGLAGPRRYGDDLVGLVNDVSHGPSILLFSAPLSDRSKIVAMMVSHFA